MLSLSRSPAFGPCGIPDALEAPDEVVVEDDAGGAEEVLVDEDEPPPHPAAASARTTIATHGSRRNNLDLGLMSKPPIGFNVVGRRTAVRSADADRITGLIDSAHALGRKIRFFAIPDTSTCWKKLISLHADVIGTDHINELADFLNSKAY